MELFDWSPLTPTNICIFKEAPIKAEIENCVKQQQTDKFIKNLNDRKKHICEVWQKSTTDFSQYDEG